MNDRPARAPELSCWLRRLHAQNGEDQSGSESTGRKRPTVPVCFRKSRKMSEPTDTAASRAPGRTISWLGGACQRNAWFTVGPDGSMLLRMTAFILMGPISREREEAVESLYDSLMEYTNARPRACPRCRASAAAADPRSCRSRRDLPGAHVLRATGASNRTVPPVFA